MSSSDFTTARTPRDAFAPLLARIAGQEAVVQRTRSSGPFPEFDEALAPVASSPSEEEERLAQQRAHEAELQAAYERGAHDGRSEARSELSEIAAGLARAIEEVERFRSHLAERYEQELLALAVQVAGKILRTELEADPEWWLPLIRDAVHRAVDRERIRIRAGAGLHAFLAPQLAKLRASLEEVRELELLEDPSLSDTGCVIETSYGDLDASIESQLEAVRMALTEPE